MRGVKVLGKDMERTALVMCWMRGSSSPLRCIACAQALRMCYSSAMVNLSTRAHSSRPPSQAAGTSQVTDDLESGEPAQAPAAAASPPVPAAPTHNAGGIACPVRAVLVVLASVVCACIGVWLMLDDQHVPLTPSCAPGARASLCCALDAGTVHDDTALIGFEQGCS